MIRTIKEMVTLIVQAGLLPLYWSETLATAVYLRNRIMTNASISGLTPFSTLYPKNRDEDHYSRLRPFGCLCYALVPEEKQENFTTKTRVCLFLGYVWNSRSIYKVIDVVTHHVFTTPSVDFDEYSFPGLPNHSVNPNLFPFRSWMPQNNDNDRGIQFWKEFHAENPDQDIEPPSKRIRSSKGASNFASHVADTEGGTTAGRPGPGHGTGQGIFP
jgi:hypothetical protein